MEQGDKTRLYRVKEGIHQGWNIIFSRVGDLFILTTDWRKENIVGVLSQVQNGQERFLGC